MWEKRVAKCPICGKRDNMGDVAAHGSRVGSTWFQRLRVRNRTLRRGGVHQRSRHQCCRDQPDAANNGDGQRFMLLNICNLFAVF